MVIQNTRVGEIDVLGLGEIVIDFLLKIPRFPKPDEKMYVLNSQKQAGGVTANFCVGVARQGLRVAFFGGVGDDEEGGYLRKALQKEIVDDRYLFTLKSKITPVNIVMVTKKGEKSILQSEHMRLTLPSKKLITKEIIQKSRHLHLTAINYETALKAVTLAKEFGLTTSLDLESQVVHDYQEQLAQLLEFIDILLPNKGGAYEFTRSEDPILASMRLLKYGPKVVLLTLGSEGVLLSTKEDQRLFPAYKVDNVIDTTGAGDAFNAGFISSFLEDRSLEECVNRGQATSALKIQGFGAQAPLPTKHMVSEFILENS
ncbi:MAG: carbohydrate kinase family protein [Promethearchaeota archaeon]